MNARYFSGLPLLALVAPLAAQAAAPPLVPVTGFLTDDAGAPITDTVALELALYTSANATSPLWSEVQAVDVDGGQFTVYLGEQTPLTLDTFRDHGTLYLGITVGTGAEMTPRFEVATAPFAAFAQYCDDAATVGGIDPSDFRLVSDTIGWSDLTPSTLPAGLADGDNDTTYTAGTGVLLANRVFSADQSTIQLWSTNVAYDTLAELRTELDGIYAAKQTCTNNQVLAANSVGVWVCTNSTALPISEAAVDAAVLNNGYALASDLATLNTAVTTAQSNITTLQGSVGTINTDVTSLQGSVGTINTNVTALQGSVATLQTQLSSSGVVDYRYTQTNAPMNLTGIIPWDDTIPQITEGSEVLTVAITPKKTADLLVIEGTINWVEPVNHSNYFTVALFRDAGVNAIATAVDGASNGNGRCTANGYTQICTMPIRFTLVAGSTAATTFRLRAGLDGGNVYINQANDGRKLGGTLYSTLSVTEMGQ